MKPITWIQPTALKSLNYRLLEAKRVFGGEQHSRFDSLDCPYAHVTGGHQTAEEVRTISGWSRCSHSDVVTALDNQHVGSVHMSLDI